MFFSNKDRGKARVDEIKDIMDIPPAEEMPIVERETGAPLFVKVDKYRDIIKSVQEMKLFVASTKQVFTALHEIESLRSDTLNVLRATIQRLERSITEIDTELVRPHGVSVAAEESVEVTHIESSLNDLQKQLLDLKRDLQEMK